MPNSVGSSCAFSEQIFKRAEFSFQVLYKRSDLVDRPIAPSHLIRICIPHEVGEVCLNVLQSNGRDQPKVVEVIEKTVWVCHSISGNRLSERGVN
jgi:hypothetical protein